MTASAALYALGLDWTDVIQLALELRAAIRHANRDLMESFQ